MGEVIFCQTDDGSIGLYNEQVGDIYHSTYGAYSESYEKFLEASGFLEFIKENTQVKILDICYGIGYNTKTALDEILKLNKTMEVRIDALEYDENLIQISPLLKHQKISNCINEFLIRSSNIKPKLSIFGIYKYFFKTRGLEHINWRNYALMIEKFCFPCLFLYPLVKLLTLQHNIYYNYIAFRMKKGSKTSKLKKTSVRFHSDDARKSILTLSDQYNYIFLDAFTPKKLPTLWSYEFIKELYRLLDNNGVLVTYSSSAAVRAAMIEAGFYIGKSVNSQNKIIGTIAVKNKSLIKHELSEFDLGLLKTRAGIFYRDQNLTGLNEAIIEAREKEVLASDRISSSQYMKSHSRN